jgi:hypothetical protein
MKLNGFIFFYRHLFLSVVSQEACTGKYLMQSE